MSPRVVVVGAGVAGLASAHRLLRSPGAPEVVVLEADEHVGGKIGSATVGGLDLEAGPDSLLARKPWAVELCRELGLGDDLVSPTAVQAQVYGRAGLVAFPSGPYGISTDLVEMLRWPGMSYAGKIRAGLDLVRPKREEQGDESLGSLLRRRIGDEATQALVAPLLGGLFAGDVDRLSVRATFPELEKWEREHGSLVLGARAASASSRAARPAGSAPPPMFLRLRGGLRRLTDALAEAIGHERLTLGTPARAVRSEGDGFVVEAEGREVEADAVVLATPSFVTADLVADLSPGIVPALRSIPHVSTAVVLMAYEEGSGSVLPDTSGFLAPAGALAVTAATLISRKWPDPAFGDRAVVRAFVGSLGTEGSMRADDDQLVERVAAQLAELYPLPPRPEDATVVRWPRAMPQYEVGHLETVDAIEAGLPPGVFVVGQSFRGTGIPDCVRQGNEVVERVQAHIGVRPEAGGPSSLG